jgi:hypothetical protein
MEPTKENTYVTLEWGELKVRHKDNQYYTPNSRTILARALLRDNEDDGVYGYVQLQIDHDANVIDIGRPRSLVKGIHFTRVLDLVTAILDSGTSYIVTPWSA